MVRIEPNQETVSTDDAAAAFVRWEEGQITAREALQAIVAADYLAADAAFKAAEQRKKQVRGQLELLVRAVGESVVCAGFALAWREGTMAPSYPAQRVEWAVRTLHALIAQLLGCPQLPHAVAPAVGETAPRDTPDRVPQATPATVDDAPPPDVTYLVPHALVEEVIATIEHLAAGREERARAGALYIVSEEAKQRQERRQVRNAGREDAA